MYVLKTTITSVENPNETDDGCVMRTSCILGLPIVLLNAGVPNIKLYAEIEKTIRDLKRE
jgi:hypothetical protein